MPLEFMHTNSVLEGGLAMKQNGGRAGVKGITDPQKCGNSTNSGPNTRTVCFI